MNAEPEQASRRAISLCDDVVRFHHALGIALQRQNRLEEAIIAAHRAAELAPDNAELRRNLDSCLLAAYHIDEAFER
jgi:Flp pilus assembly protein TadD